MEGRFTFIDGRLNISSGMDNNNHNVSGQTWQERQKQGCAGITAFVNVSAKTLQQLYYAC